MRETGFEPAQALSYESLNLARLTTPAIPHDKINLMEYKNFYNRIIMFKNFENFNILIFYKFKSA